MSFVNGFTEGWTLLPGDPNVTGDAQHGLHAPAFVGWSLGQGPIDLVAEGFVAPLTMSVAF